MRTIRSERIVRIDDETNFLSRESMLLMDHTFIEAGGRNWLSQDCKQSSKTAENFPVGPSRRLHPGLRQRPDPCWIQSRRDPPPVQIRAGYINPVQILGGYKNPVTWVLFSKHKLSRGPRPTLGHDPADASAARVPGPSNGRGGEVGAVVGAAATRRGRFHQPRIGNYYRCRRPGAAVDAAGPRRAAIAKAVRDGVLGQGAVVAGDVRCRPRVFENRVVGVGAGGRRKPCCRRA